VSAKKKAYVLYDERALYDVDNAAVLTVSDSLREARADRRDMFPNGVIYEYDERVGDEYKNGRMIP